jgi:hypothetical protein
MPKLSHLLTECVSRLSPGLAGLAALGTLLGGVTPADASVPLRRADIEQILNRVELIPRRGTSRTARVDDFMAIGDALRTAAASRAELRFNDGSLARIGERATFHFIPNTRNFRLSDGTMLLLIPPGRGRSTIQTPSAVTGIQGSALVIRHVQSRDLTLVMALTNNEAGAMTVTLANCDRGDACTSEVNLMAGEMALIQEGQVEVLAFDLKEFYETSPLIEGLELTEPNSTLNLGNGTDEVRQEIQDALDNYQPFDDDQSVLLNPTMISINGNADAVAGQPWLLKPQATTPASPTAERATLPLPAGLLAETSTAGVVNTSQAGGVEAPARAPTPQTTSTPRVQPSNPPSVSIPPVGNASPQVPDPTPAPGGFTPTDGSEGTPVAGGGSGDPVSGGGITVDISSPGRSSEPPGSGGAVDPGPAPEPPVPGGGSEIPPVGGGGSPEPTPGPPTPGNEGGSITPNPANEGNTPPRPEVNPGQGINTVGESPANPGNGTETIGGSPAAPGNGTETVGGSPANPGNGIETVGGSPANPGNGTETVGGSPANPGNGTETVGGSPANLGGDGQVQPDANPGGANGVPEGGIGGSGIVFPDKDTVPEP